MKTRTMLVGLGLGLMACSDAHFPTAVTPSTPPALRPEQVTAIQAMLADAQDRLLPALRDHGLAESVGRNFAIGARYLGRDRDQFRAALEQAKAALGGTAIAVPSGATQASPADDGALDDAPIVENLELVIALIEAAVADQL